MNLVGTTFEKSQLFVMKISGNVCTDRVLNGKGVTPQNPIGLG